MRLFTVFSKMYAQWKPYFSTGGENNTMVLCQVTQAIYSDFSPSAKSGKLAGNTSYKQLMPIIYVFKAGKFKV